MATHRIRHGYIDPTLARGRRSTSIYIITGHILHTRQAIRRLCAIGGLHVPATIVEGAWVGRKDGVCSKNNGVVDRFVKFRVKNSDIKLDVAVFVYENATSITFLANNGAVLRDKLGLAVRAASVAYSSRGAEAEVEKSVRRDLGCVHRGSTASLLLENLL